MNTNRIWIIGTVLLSAAVIALGWFLGVSPKLAETADTQLQILAVSSQNAQYEADLAALKVEYEKLPQITAELEALRVSLPPTAEYAEFVAQLNQISSKAGVSVSGLTPGVPQLFTPVAAPVVEGEAVAADPVAPAADTNFVVVPISIEVGGTVDEVTRFIGGLQGGDRLFLLTGVDMTELPKKEKAKTAGGFLTKIDGYIYVLLDPTLAVTPEATPTAEAEVPTDAETTDPSDTGAETPTPTETPVP